MEARSHFDLSTIQRSYPHFTGGNPERSDSFPKATQLGSSRARTRTESLERVSQERAPPKAARPDRRTPHCHFCRRNGLRFTLGENTGPCGVTPSLSFPVCPKGPLSKTEPHPHSLLPSPEIGVIFSFCLMSPWVPKSHLLCLQLVSVFLSSSANTISTMVEAKT